MKKSTVPSMTVKKLRNMLEKGQVSFDYPIQRQGGQWDLLQKSLLIHSLAGDYPVPPLYSLLEKEVVGEGEKAKEVNVYFILDGKQRTTNIIDFLNNGYRLHEDTPKVNVDGEFYEIAEMQFDELNEDVQNAILDFSLQLYKFDEATDEEIEDVFYRLNNGTPLSKQQKAKAKMGTETAKQLKTVLENDLITQNANFTDLQKRKADDELAVIQSMMLLDDSHELKSFSSNHVFEYSIELREGKQDVFARLETAMDFLHGAFEDTLEKTLLKKLHFPMMIFASDIAVKNDIPQVIFKEWLDGFKKEINRKDNGELSENPMGYKLGMGAGSVKKEKVNTRVKYVADSLNELIAKLNADANGEGNEGNEIEEQSNEVVENENEAVLELSSEQADSEENVELEPTSDGLGEEQLELIQE